MPGIFATAFKGQKGELAKTIDFGTGLCLRLIDRNVLTNEKAEICEAKSTDTERVKKLLEILEKCDDQYFEPFCDALVEIGQKHVVKMLRDNLLKERYNTDSSSVDRAAEQTTRNRKSVPLPVEKQADFPKDQPQRSTTSVRCYYIVGLIVFAGVVISAAAWSYLWFGSSLNVINTDVKRSNNVDQRSDRRSFKEMFEGKKKQLIDSIDPSPEFWAVAEDKKLLTKSQIAQCKLKGLVVDKIDCVLGYLVMRDTEQRVADFCDLLKETDQVHVIENHLSVYCNV